MIFKFARVLGKGKAQEGLSLGKLGMAAHAFNPGAPDDAGRSEMLQATLSSEPGQHGVRSISPRAISMKGPGSK